MTRGAKEDIRTSVSGVAVRSCLSILVPHCFVAHARILSCLHADRLPSGHAAVLRSSRLPASAFALPHNPCACAFVFSRWTLWGRCFARARCHGVMSACGHSVIWTPEEGQRGDNRRTRGDEEDNRGEKRKDKKRTTGGHGLEPVATRGQQEVKNVTKGGQQEDKKRTGSGQKETAKGQGLEVG